MVLKNKLSTKLSIDFDLFDWLKSEAARKRTSVSALVRELIVAEIERKKTGEGR